MPDLPNVHTAIVLALAALALVLFATGRFRLETTALGILLALLLTFTILPLTTANGTLFNAADLLSAFGNEALVAVCALMILGKGIETTHALQPLVASIARHWSSYPGLMTLGMLITAALLSAFLNNTPIVVVLIPALVSIAAKSRTPASKLLLPMGLITSIGGMATTIGTSTNLLVVNMSESIAGVQFSMFEFSRYILIAGGIGLVYLWLIAPMLIPDRRARITGGRAREFIATLHLEPGSSLVGKTVAQFLRISGHSLAIDQIQHGDKAFRTPLPSVELHENDRIFVRGSRDDLKEAEHVLRAPLDTMDSTDLLNPALEPRLAEVLITERSELDGLSLEQSAFKNQFGLRAIALHRPQPERRRKKRALGHIPLRAGDILLCEGTRDDFDQVSASTRLLVLGAPTDLPLTKRASIALAIVTLVVAVAAIGLLPIVISALAGVLLMIALHCLGWRHLIEALSSQVILIIVVSLAIGKSLIATGGDVYLASVFNHLFEGAGPAVVLSALMLFMAILTNVVSNNAAAVIGTPVAVQIALQLGISPEPLLLAVLFGANLCFATPIGYQTNLLVFSAGGYRFSDFVRVGGPLTLLMWAVLSWLLSENYALI